MEMQSTKKQHYVSRLYLKQWADKDEKIWCFDKEQNHSFNPNIMGIAQERFFYEFKCLKDDDFSILEKMWVENKTPILKETNKGFIDIFKKINVLLKTLDLSNNEEMRKIKDYTEKNLIEQMFGCYEKKFASLIEDLLTNEIPDWNGDDQMSFLFSLNLQYFRTKNISDRLLKNSLKLSKSTQFDDFVERAMNPMRWLAANTVTYSSLNGRKFVFIKNDSDIDFITTDQPVVNIFSTFGKDAVEMSDKEMELYCPFSPKKAILVSFRDCYSDMSCISATEKDVDVYNKTLVKGSNRFIFSQNKEGLDPWISEK